MKDEAPADLLKRARAKMKTLDFEGALPVLARVGEHPAATPREKADAQIDIGICHVNVGETSSARTAFERALDLDAAAAPPSSAPPKVQTLFKSVSDARFAPPPPPPTPDVPLVATAPVTTPVTPVAPPPAVVAPAPAPSSAVPTVLGVGLGVVAAGGVVAGILTALESQRAAQALRSELRPGAEAQALAQQQQTMGTVSLVAYVGAGVAAAGAVTAILLGGRGSGPSVAVAPTPDGFTAAAAVSF